MSAQLAFLRYDCKALQRLLSCVAAVIMSRCRWRALM